jgi:hypothetical protein
MKEENHLQRKFKDANSIVEQTTWSKEDLWNSIERNLDNKSSRNHILRKRILPWAAIILLGLSALFYSELKPDTYESIEITVAPQIEQILIENAQTQEGKAFIDESCKKQLKVCESPNFLSLSTHLDKIDTERASLLEMMSRYGKDDVMMKALIELENAEAEITSKMIKIILS